MLFLLVVVFLKLANYENTRLSINEMFKNDMKRCSLNKEPNYDRQETHWLRVNLSAAPFLPPTSRPLAIGSWLGWNHYCPYKRLFRHQKNSTVG